MRALPRLGALLRIAPAEFERDFWCRSEHQRRLASFLDLWSLSFTVVNNTMVMRFVTKSPELLPYAGFLGFIKSWAIMFLLLGLVQIAWRSLGPASYQRWRFCVLIFNRMTRAIYDYKYLHISMGAAQALALAAMEMLPRIGPVRVVILSSGVMQPFISGCNFILPFRLQVPFHLASLLLHTSLYTSSAVLILTGAPALSAPVPWPKLAPRCPPFCAAPALSRTPTCGAATPSPVLQAARTLCSRFHGWDDWVHTSVSMVSFSMFRPHDPCRGHAPAILVLFANLLMGLFVPVFLAYRLERHAKAMYVKDMRASLRAAITPPLDGDQYAAAAPPDPEACGIADETPHSLPHWTDLAILASLALAAWEAAVGLHQPATVLHLVS